MFENLTQRLGEVFDRLTRRGALSEADVDAALREVRVALLEADVALPVVKDFVEAVKAKAIGEAVIKSVTPGQMVIKIVHDHLVATLGTEAGGLDLSAAAPIPILMVGLQGSGKTTTTAKIALRLKGRDRRKTLMASLDTRRPAAMEQLAILGAQAEVTTLNIVPGEPPIAIARRALQTAKLGAFDVLLLDTAGRLHIDDELMGEVATVRDAVKPHETLLVVDAMTGQDAVNVAQAFRDKVGLIGVGEKLDALEDFHPSRIAGRILGMGDVVSLVEKAAETIEQEEAEKLAAKMQKGQFDLDDLSQQLKQLQKMGGLGGIMGMLPGIGKIQRQLGEAKIDERILKRQQAIISSMTKLERRKPELIKASRKQRIATGSGTSVADVNKLLKQHMEMQRMMKQMNKLGKKGLMRHGLSALMSRH